MRTLMLLQTSFPPDIRVENEILSLTRRGMEVHILCKNGGKDAYKEKWGMAQVHRLVGPARSKLLMNILQVPAFINILWLLKSFRLIKKYSINIVHVHDLPLTPVAILLKKILGVSIIYDMHENYPAALRAWRKKGLEYWLKHPHTFQMLENYVIPRFDALIAVVSENKDRIIHEQRVVPERIFVVSNYVNLNTFKPDYPYQNISLPENAQIFLYTGGLDSHRGLDITLAAFKEVIPDYPDIYLMVVGGGKSAAGKQTELELRDTIEKDEVLQSHVLITGWLDIKYIPWLIERSSFCLIPQAANEHTDTTIPHKLFQYMSFGKPIIAADAKPMVRFITDSQSGITFKSGNVASYASAIRQLLATDYKSLSLQARALALKNYTWENAEVALFATYELAIGESRDEVFLTDKL